MAFFIEGALVEMLIVIAIAGIMVWAARRKEMEPLRRLPALDVIEEFVGRSVEMGKPVLTTPASRFGLQSNYAPSTAVGLDMVGYVAKLCCETGADIIIGVGQSDVLSVTFELYRDACIASGHPEMYKEENVRYFAYTPGTYGAFHTGMMEVIEREGAGCVMLFGEMWWENIFVGGAARRAGAMSLGSGAWFDMASVGFVNCDYMLLADEQFCAGAYVSKDPSKTNLLLGADVLKWFFILMSIVGTIFITGGSTLIKDILQI
jgi:hypothetical protein